MSANADSIPRYEPPDVSRPEPEPLCDTCSHVVEIRVGRRRELICVAEHDDCGTDFAALVTEPVTECNEWEPFDEL